MTVSQPSDAVIGSGHEETRVLVIDDDPQMRSFMEKCLTRAGYEVTLARDGAEGLYIFDIEPFDLIITDLFMPDRDGLEVLRDIHRKAHAVPILVISGGSPDMPQDFLQFASALGADTTLSKPFGPDELLDAVSKLLQDDPHSA